MGAPAQLDVDGPRTQWRSKTTEFSKKIGPKQHATRVDCKHVANAIVLFLVSLIEIEGIDSFTESINGDPHRLETVWVIGVDDLRPDNGSIRFQ